MNILEWILIGLIMVCVILCSLYIYSLSKIKVRSVDFNQLQDISLSGFTLGGYVEVHNDGVLSVGVDHIAYNVILEQTEDQLVQGCIIQGTTIPPGSTIKYPISSKINWKPSAELALDLITGNNAYASISGMVYVADLKIIEIKVPFQTRINLEPYVRQFIVNKIEQMLFVVTINNIEQGVKSIINMAINGIKKIFW